MKILYVCTHNRCRSILAEAITNHLSDGSWVARSAGSQPVGDVHPLSLHHLAEAGIDASGLESQSWDDHEKWQPDIVITVCDSAAGESCPTWFGKALRAHWGLKDPSRETGSDEQVARCFQETISTLQHRIRFLIDAQANTSDQDSLQQLLDDLGRTEK